MQLSDNARSVLLMNVAMATFTINDTSMKLVMQDIGFSQAVGLRGVMTTLALAFLTWRLNGWHKLPARRDLSLIGLRTLADLMATVTFLLALQHMVIADLSAILQSLPLAVTLASALFFGERIGWHRLGAIIVGLVGVLIILQPGRDGFDLWALLGLASVCCVVARDLTTRRMHRGVPSALIACCASVAVTAMGLGGMAIEGWQPMRLADWGLILLAGSTLIIGYLTVVATMRIGDVGVVAPFRYMSLLWAILLGWIAFGTLPGASMLMGAVLVVGSGIYTILRERARRA